MLVTMKKSLHHSYQDVNYLSRKHATLQSPLPILMRSGIQLLSTGANFFPRGSASFVQSGCDLEKKEATANMPAASGHARENATDQ